MSKPKPENPEKPIKLPPASIKPALALLRMDLLTEQTTRPAGPHDSSAPHLAIKDAVTKEVAKQLRAIKAPKERHAGAVQAEIKRWNHYLEFAFDPAHASPVYYEAHKDDIESIAQICQKGPAKGQLDRQLIWRHKQLAQATDEQSQWLAQQYLDLAIQHNTGFIMGTIGRVLSSLKRPTDREASEFTADAIGVIKDKVPQYDPSLTAISSYMTQPIGWAILRNLKGKAQDRFDRRMRKGLDLSRSDNDDISPLEPVDKPQHRDQREGFAFFEGETGEMLMERLRAAGEKLLGARARMVFAYKLEHPTATLEETGKACGCTRENVRQGLFDVGKQISRIDPELARYLQGMLNHNADEMDEERLEIRYKRNDVQLEVASLLDQLRAELETMRAAVGEDNITMLDGKMLVSKLVTRGNASMQRKADNLIATHEAVEALQLVVDSPFVDAGFDAMDIRSILKVAFYPGGSRLLEAFIEDNIEDMAIAARQRMKGEMEKSPAKAQAVKTLVDRFFAAKPGELSSFGKHDVNALFAAECGTDGCVPARLDLLLVREMGAALVGKRELRLR